MGSPFRRRREGMGSEKVWGLVICTFANRRSRNQARHRVMQADVITDLSAKAKSYRPARHAPEVDGKLVTELLDCAYATLSINCFPQASAYLRSVASEGECLPVASDRSKRAIAGA